MHTCSQRKRKSDDNAGQLTSPYLEIIYCGKGYRQTLILVICYETPSSGNHMKIKPKKLNFGLKDVQVIEYLLPHFYFLTVRYKYMPKQTRPAQLTPVSL